MTALPELDRERIERLAAAILRPIRDNYLTGPQSRDRVFEALNALAFVACTVIKGADNDAKAVWFFQQAMNNHIGSDG